MVHHLGWQHAHVRQAASWLTKYSNVNNTLTLPIHFSHWCVTLYSLYCCYFTFILFVSFVYTSWQPITSFGHIDWPNHFSECIRFLEQRSAVCQSLMDPVRVRLINVDVLQSDKIEKKSKTLDWLMLRHTLIRQSSGENFFVFEWHNTYWWWQPN